MKGLSFQAFEDDVRGLFEQCGEVTNVKMLMRPDGKPKGLAFVKFNKRSSLEKALEFSNTEQFGRAIVVEEALGKPQQGGRNDGGFKKGGNFNDGGNKFQNQGPANITTATLFIGGLSYNSTQESISDYFSSVGEVIRARVVTDR